MAFLPVEDQISNTDVCTEHDLPSTSEAENPAPPQPEKKERKKKKKKRKESHHLIIIHFTLKHHPHRRHMSQSSLMGSSVKALIMSQMPSKKTYTILNAIILAQGQAGIGAISILNLTLY